MIDIYLNPDQDIYYSKLNESKKMRVIPVDHLEAASSLLMELHGKIEPEKYLILEALTLVFSKDKASIK